MGRDNFRPRTGKDFEIPSMAFGSYLHLGKKLKGGRLAWPANLIGFGLFGLTVKGGTRRVL